MNQASGRLLRTESLVQPAFSSPEPLQFQQVSLPRVYSEGSFDPLQNVGPKRHELVRFVGFGVLCHSSDQNEHSLYGCGVAPTSFVVVLPSA